VVGIAHSDAAVEAEAANAVDVAAEAAVAAAVADLAEAATVDAHGRESLQSPIRIQDPGLMNDSVLEFTTGTRITECSTCTGTLPI
jgi:hypothetical protein